MSFFDTLFGIRSWKISEVMITDVTRMQGDKVCIAALNGRNNIRLHDPSPTEHWLQSIGGLVPGDRVSLTWKLSRHSRRPHLEDEDWSPPLFKKISRLTEDELVRRLSVNAVRSINDAFGKPYLYSETGNAAFTPGKGARSLASLIVSRVTTYPYDGGVRVDFADDKREWTKAPLEDLTIRHHQTSCSGCSSNLANLLEAEFAGTQAVLRVGLGRPFQAGDHPPACWLQVNHIFLIPSKRKHFA